MLKRHIGYLIITLVLIQSCATIVPLTGGDKDETPPSLIRVDKKENKVILSFDENINLGNQNDIVTNIYPRPTFQVSRKKLTIKGVPNDDSTKRIIYFNKSIQDLNENNPLLNYVYAENVGSDTFSTSGEVKTAFNAVKDFSNCYVLLIDSKLELNEEKDIYRYDFTKTDKEGIFTLDYIPNPAGKQLFVFLDNNNNKIPDDGDLIGLGTSVSSDTSHHNHILLTQKGKNYISDREEKGVLKKIYRNINYHLVNDFDPGQETVLNDTSYSLTNITDSLILSKTDPVISGEHIYMLSRYPNPIFPEKFFKPINSSQWEVLPVSQDTTLAIRNNKGDTLQFISLIADKDLSSISFYTADTSNKTSYNGILFNEYFFHKIGPLSEKRAFSVVSGKYFMFIYRDDNQNGKFDTSSLFPLRAAEEVLYNMKDIDIGPRMDVEIELK